MIKKLLIISAILMFSGVALAQNKSVYSELTTKNCVNATPSNSIGGNYFSKCKGVGGFNLELYSDDERDALGVVFPSKKVAPLTLWNYFRYFSQVGEKAEWRMKGGKPVALIVRLNTTDSTERKLSYLIVAKITNETTCVTDVVNPSKNQNAIAKKLADKAASKKCMAGFEDTGSADNSNQPQAVLHDQFILNNEEDLMARFDNFAVQMQNAPEAKGYIVINGKKNARSKAEQQIKKYAQQRMTDSSRLVYIDKEDDKGTVIKFWIVPPGAYVPER